MTESSLVEPIGNEQYLDDEKVEVSNRMRMFFMGNALVTGIVKRIGIELGHIIEEF